MTDIDDKLRNAFATPYREAAVDDVRLKNEARVVALARELLGGGVRREALYPIVEYVTSMATFEATASGAITAEEGAAIIVLRRDAERSKYPWYVRLALWLWELR